MPPEPPPPGPGLSAPLPDHQFATNLVVPVVPGTEVPLAQLFLQYFGSRHGNTNGNGVGLLAPVGFVPPQPIIPPSSSASFKTTPAETP
jgi:hypothetical protein